VTLTLVVTPATAKPGGNDITRLLRPKTRVLANPNATIYQPATKRGKKTSPNRYTIPLIRTIRPNTYFPTTLLLLLEPSLEFSFLPCSFRARQSSIHPTHHLISTLAATCLSTCLTAYSSSPIALHSHQQSIFYSKVWKWRQPKPSRASLLAGKPH